MTVCPLSCAMTFQWITQAAGSLAAALLLGPSLHLDRAPQLTIGVLLNHEAAASRWSFDSVGVSKFRAARWHGKNSNHRAADWCAGC